MCILWINFISGFYSKRNTLSWSILTKIWYYICSRISNFLFNLCYSLGCNLKFNYGYSCFHVILTNLIVSNVNSMHDLLVSSYKRWRRSFCFIGEIIIPICVKGVLIILISLAYCINIKYSWGYWIRIPSIKRWLCDKS